MEKSRALVFLFMFLCGTLAADSIVSELLTNLENCTQESDSISEISLDMIRDNDVVNYQMMLWANEQNYVSRIERPLADKGTVYLYSEGNAWTYYPKIEKTIRTSSNSKLLGSDFSFQEIIGLDFRGKYDLSIADFNEVKDPNIDEEFQLASASYVIQADVKEGNNVQFPRVIIYFNEDKLPIQQEYFSISGLRLGIIKYQEYGELDGKLMATKLSSYSSLNTDRYSTLTYKSILRNQNIDESYFSSFFLDKISRGRM